MEKLHEELTNLYLDYMNNYTQFLDRPTKIKKIYLKKLLRKIKNTIVVLRPEIEIWHDKNRIYDHRKNNTLKKRYSRPKKNINTSNT